MLVVVMIEGGASISLICLTAAVKHHIAPTMRQTTAITNTISIQMSLRLMMLSKGGDGRLGDSRSAVRHCFALCPLTLQSFGDGGTLRGGPTMLHNTTRRLASSRPVPSQKLGQFSLHILDAFCKSGSPPQSRYIHVRCHANNLPLVWREVK